MHVRIEIMYKVWNIHQDNLKFKKQKVSINLKVAGGKNS